MNGLDFLRQESPWPYQVMPELPADEYAELRDNIAEHGIRVPVDVDEGGLILDGHHRNAVALELGLMVPRRTVTGLTDEQKRDYAFDVNIRRRQLSREQKRELLAAAIKATPEQSNRQIAERAGVSHPTVAAVREELEESGDVERLSTRTDSSGRTQPASKPAHVTSTTRTTESTKVERDIDLDTGEIVDDSPAAVIASALQDSKTDPVVLAQKAYERFHDALKTIDAAGGIDAITNALADHPIQDDSLYLNVLDRTVMGASTWASAIRRRNLRSVK